MSTPTSPNTDLFDTCSQEPGTPYKYKNIIYHQSYHFIIPHIERHLAHRVPLFVISHITMAYNIQADHYQMYGAFPTGDGDEGEYMPTMDGVACKYGPLLDFGSSRITIHSSYR